MPGHIQPVAVLDTSLHQPVTFEESFSSRLAFHFPFQNVSVADVQVSFELLDELLPIFGALVGSFEETP